MNLRYLSLFSGLEAAHLAWQSLGWTCAAVAEIEPNACSVLARRLPGVPNLGDVSQISNRQVAALGHLDVVIGGSPCQDMSVSGKRAGLAGARSSLFHEQLRIFHATRTFCGARWLVWENVPGAFSSNAGRDFAVVAGSLAGCHLDVPADGWGNEGVALGENGLVEWSVLDAQWFGVAQRRRRVFAVLDTGDWSGRPPVLLEPDILRGDSPPRREAGAGATVGTLGGTSPGGGWRVGADEAAALAVMAHGQGGAEVSDGNHCPTLTCNHEAPIIAFQGRGSNIDLGQEVTGTLTGNSGCANGGAPCIAFDTTQITSPGNVSSPKPGDPCHPLAAGAHPPAIISCGCKDSDPGRGVGYDVAQTLRAMGHKDSHQNAGGQIAVVANTPTSMQVRRLTPRECERLQGVVDDWTLVPNDRGKLMADGPRYKMLGNSFAVPVIRWIGERIQAAHAHSEVEVA